MGEANIYIGLMSGTSMDGVDAVLAEFGDQTRVIASHSACYPTDLSQKLRQAASGQALNASDWLTIDSEVAQHFAASVEELLGKAGICENQVRAIGFHGQTVWHQPDGNHPNTWQIGNPNIVAAITGITTVADIRRMDMAYGGQGAPLVPAFHASVLSSPSEKRVVLNLGGIANITSLAPLKAVYGYDTGPANCLLDAHSRLALNKAFDEAGQWASSGHVSEPLLNAMLADPYFKRSHPKSTGPEYFSWKWVEQHLTQHSCEDADLQATLSELSAHSIAMAINMHGANRVIACGGGVHNTDLMKRIQSALPNTAIETSAEHGIDPQLVEALAFAWLAKQRLEEQPGNLPSVTGASKACALGAVYLP